MTTKTPPPRLHVLMARNAPAAVIIRRGPAKSVCTIGWNREKDEFQIGQWFRGRIYAERCDISPDGRHLIYFAANYNWNSETKGTWTAISRAPYIKAISLWPKGDTYHGGGIFLNDKTVLFHGAHSDALQISTDIKAVSDVRTWGRGSWTNKYQPPEDVRRIENLDAFLSGPERDIFENSCAKRLSHYRSFEEYRAGWRLDETGKEGGLHWWVGQHVTKDWWLRKPAKADGYRLINHHNQTVIDLPKGADWAQRNDWREWQRLPREGRIVWTREGKLYAANVTRQGVGDAEMLYDFCPMEFEAIAAPY